MGMAGTWNPAEVGPEHIARAIAAFEAALDAGITLFDHADIYGGTACESIFKHCLKAVPGIRSKIVIATKCGIRNGYFQLTADYIKMSLDSSMSRMGIDYVDIYQMHRPDPLTHPRETAAALRDLVKSGKVLHVAVSNYYPEQVRALQIYLEDIPIISNQIELSLLRIAPFYEGWKSNDDGSQNGFIGDGVLDQCMAQSITPLAWSPLGSGNLSATRTVPDDHPRKRRIEAVIAELRAQAERHNFTPGQIALAWLLAHPSGIIPLAGSNNPLHIHEAAGATEVNMSREEWYALWTAAWGRKAP
jgi:predicted oxidoreductase